MAKTTVYGGPGNPLNITTFIDSSFGRHYRGDVLGDGRTSADFSYRLPGLRNWLTLYGETLSEDEPSPIPYMRRNASQGGLYLTKVLEFRSWTSEWRAVIQVHLILRDLHLLQRTVQQRVQQ